MKDSGSNPYYNSEPYVPETLSEINDFLAVLLGGAPTFVDETGFYPKQNIDTRFHQLTEAFSKVRMKLGEERYAKLVELSARTKALFLADPNDDNGKTLEGCKLIWEIEDIIQDARKRRTKAKLKDDQGEVTGD